MKLEVGKYYWTRGGGIVKIIEYFHSCYRPFANNLGRTYSEEGMWCSYPSSNDLVRECDATKISSLNYPVGFKGGKMIVGCQTISKEGQLELFHLLADKLGYEVES